ncbi:hypothetical protein [Bacillus anthracis]|nr:hypothetical protein [Bacillus anthracis]
MPTKDAAKEVHLAVRNEDGTFGTPILIRPMKEEDSYADSDECVNG